MPSLALHWALWVDIIVYYSAQYDTYFSIQLAWSHCPGTAHKRERGRKTSLAPMLMQ